MRTIALISRRGALLGAVLGLLAGASACQSPGEQAAQLRLKFIDDTLLTTSEALARDNDGLVKAIHAQVDKNQRPPAELRVLRRAEAVHDSTQQLIGYLRELRGRLLRQTGNELHFRQLDGRREVAALLGRGSAADSLHRRLRHHARYLQQLAPAPDPLPPADFTDAAVTGALATLAGQETRLLLREAEALTVLQARVMTSVLKTSYRALAGAETNVVAPGTTYRADLLLAAALYRPTGFTMTANGQPVAAGPDGFGQVAFAVPPLRGAARRQASWVGSITVRHNGRDTTFQATVPYTIVPRR
jgi:GldM N-terminal domain